MSLSADEIRKVASLARLELSPVELAKMTEQLSAILDYFDQLKQVPTGGVEPLAHPLNVHNVFRDDVIEPSLPLERVLANAPATDGPFFKVPKVLGADEDSAG